MKKNILLLVIFLIFTSSSFACDCIMYNLKSYYKSIKYIYTGKVIELIEVKYNEIMIPEFIESEEQRKEYLKLHYPKRYFAKVRVIKSFKKVKESEIILLESNFSNCQPSYELNQTYLFFANKIKKGKMMMDGCSPWETVKNSSENISKLEKLTK